MRRIELLYFPGCPHVEAARTQLRRAFEATGLEASWTEHDVTSPNAPAAFQGYGSPTILIDGVDVTGAPKGEGASCRLYVGTDLPGAPPLADLVRALKH